MKIHRMVPVGMGQVKERMGVSLRTEVLPSGRQPFKRAARGFLDERVLCRRGQIGQQFGSPFTADVFGQLAKRDCLAFFRIG